MRLTPHEEDIPDWRSAILGGLEAGEDDFEVCSIVNFTTSATGSDPLHPVAAPMLRNRLASNATPLCRPLYVKKSAAPDEMSTRLSAKRQRVDCHDDGGPNEAPGIRTLARGFMDTRIHRARAPCTMPLCVGPTEDVKHVRHARTPCASPNVYTGPGSLSHCLRNCLPSPKSRDACIIQQSGVRPSVCSGDIDEIGPSVGHGTRGPNKNQW